MILPIEAYGSPVLKQKCKIITKDYPDLLKLIDDMFDSMYAANGVGLAAPQVSLSIRLFIIDTKAFSDNEESDLVPLKQVFINPKLLDESGDEWLFNEGCLSIPDIREDISRKNTIKIEYFDENFKKYCKEFKGINARVIQHEYDHIEGVLFIDKISQLRKRMLKGKLNNIIKGNIEPAYRMRLSK